MDSISAHSGDSINDLRCQLGLILGLADPVSENVLFAALQDDLYAHHLITCRDASDYLDYLLTHPPKVVEDSNISAGFSSMTLAGRAAKAFARWAVDGFSVVPDVVFRRRYDACKVCPRLKSLPDKLIYKMVTGLAQEDSRICSLCGCIAVRKARLPSESCPERDPKEPELSRWGEPFL